MWMTEEAYWAAEDERWSDAFPATPTEACREYARNVGRESPDCEWILTDYDTWERNPFYRGPVGPHPEASEAEMDAWEREAWCPARPEFYGPVFAPTHVNDGDTPF